MSEPTVPIFHTFVRPTFFHRAVKLMTTPGARKEGELRKQTWWQGGGVA